MCQCVKDASPEGVCELSPSVSERLSFPDDLGGVNSLRPRCGRCCSCKSSRRFSESELNPQSKRTLRIFRMSSSRSSLLRDSDLLICSCLEPFTSKVSRKCKRISSKFGCSFSSYTIFLLVILFRSVLIEGFPPPLHKIRHHHMKPDELPPCSERPKREIRTMTLKESESAGLCPSWACLDIDERRRPVHITRVYCQESSNSTCSTLGGDFQCTQLHAQMEVWQEDSKPRDVDESRVELWTSDSKTRALVATKISVEQGCICASKKAKPSNLFKDIVA